MNLENIKVREVSAPEKGKAEVEQELLDKAEEKKVVEEQEVVEETIVDTPALDDNTVLEYLGKRYNKTIN